MGLGLPATGNGPPEITLCKNKNGKNTTRTFLESDHGAADLQTEHSERELE